MPAPYIKTSVEDQTTRVNSVGGVYSAIVIPARKGPINTPILCTSQTQFLRRFTPNQTLEANYHKSHWEAYHYLATQNKLWVVRAASDGVKYGGCVIKRADSKTVNSNNEIKDGLTTPDTYTFTPQDAFLLYGIDQGKYNNDISIIIDTDVKKTKLKNTFLLHIYYKAVEVETFLCSLDPSFKDGYGNNCYVENVLQSSLYVRAKVNPNIQNEDGTYPLPALNYVETENTTEEDRKKTLSLVGGSDGDITKAKLVTALNTLGNMNQYELQLIMDGGHSDDELDKVDEVDADENSRKAGTFANAINDLCKKRLDSCHGILSTRYSDEINIDAQNKIVDYRDNKLNLNSRLVELYTPHQIIYDEFNDRQIAISPSCFVTSLIAKHAQELGWHWAVAGYNRGVVDSLDVVKAFEMGEVNTFSESQINTIIKDPGSGNIIYDELTMLSEAKDMQEAHIARYVDIYLRPKLKASLKSFLFEFNDEQTRSLITQMIKTFMEPEKSNRAVYAYRIVCDETNNTDSDIQNNRLNIWLYIKPTKVSKFINLKVILTPYSVNLESIEV